MVQFNLKRHVLRGSSGKLKVPAGDEVTLKLAMLIEGECEGLGPIKAARKFGFSKQRYFQLRELLIAGGAAALLSRKRGPKRNYRRTDEVVRQVIRHRFLDPDATVEVIAQKLRQAGFEISIRSVERVIESFGLQKKLPRYRPGAGPTIQVQQSKLIQQTRPCDPTSIERGVRQLLADKLNDNLRHGEASLQTDSWRGRLLLSVRAAIRGTPGCVELQSLRMHGRSG